MKAKKVPVRMCAGCGGRFDKRDLVRVVRTPQGMCSWISPARWPGGAPMCATILPACRRRGRSGPLSGRWR